MKKQGIVVSVLLGLSLFWCAAPANAFVITEEADFSGETLPGTYDFSIPKFDPSNGILTQVIIELEARTKPGFAAFDNQAEVEPGAGVELGLSDVLAVEIPSVPSINLQASVNVSGSGFVEPNEPGEIVPDFQGPDSFTLDPDVVELMNSVTLNADLDDFIAQQANDEFDLVVQGDTEFSAVIEDGWGAIKVEEGDIEEGKVVVKYIFIPEPASGLLLTAAGLVLLRRRRT
jgi:hypothetical protein